MRILPSLLLLFLVAAPLAAQNPRTPILLDGSTTAPSVAPYVDSAGDLSCSVYKEDLTRNIYALVSDGRGTAWSAPLRIDTDTTGANKFLEPSSVAVSPFGNIYAAWADERAGTANDEIYFTRSTDGGATWSTEVLLDKTTASGTGAVRDWIMVMNPDAAGDHVYVLFTVDPDGSSNEALYLLASHDGGASFDPPSAVSALAAGTEDIDWIGLAAVGNTVHVIWHGDRNAGGAFDDVFYQQGSSVSGSTTWNGSDLQLDSSGVGVGNAQNDMSIDASGSVVAIAWQEEISGTTEELRGTVSTNGGATFLPETAIGGGAAADTDGVTAMVLSNGTVMFGHNDDRNGSNDAYVSVTTNGGASYTESLVSSMGASFIVNVHAWDDDPSVVGFAYSSSVFPNVAEAVYSLDNGSTWTSLVLSTNSNDVDFVDAAFNETYRNVVSVWLADDSGSNELFGGGFRPQTLNAPATITAGSAYPLTADFFFPGSEPFVGVLVSTATGSFGLPGGLNSGLGASPTLSTSITINQNAVSSGNIPGQLTMAIGAGGSGANNSPPFPGNFPANTTLYLAGVGFSVPPLSISAVTDVETTTVL